MLLGLAMLAASVAGAAAAPQGLPILDLLIDVDAGRIKTAEGTELALHGAHGQTRAVLATALGSEIQLGSLRVPEGARLEVGFAASANVFMAELPDLAEPLEVEIVFLPEASGDASPVPDEHADADEVVLLRRKIDLRSRPADRRWWDETLDLTPLAGRSGQLVLRSRNLGAADKAHMTQVLWSASRLRLPASEPRAPSVLLITIDCLRADHVGSYGYARPTTPTLDALAHDGIRFAKAYANAPMTLPSIPQIFTSRILPGRSDPTFTEAVARAGIVSAAIVNNAWIPLWLSTDLHGQPPRTFDRMISGTLDAKQITNTALDWLDTHASSRFLLYLHYLDAHTPYAPPQKWIDVFGEAGYDGLVQIPFGDAQGADAGRYDAADRRRIIDLYDAAIRSIDEQLERVMAWLREHHRLDDTILIVTADHGEEFWDHGRFFHGQSLFEELLHVPLIVRLPGEGPRGRTIERPVRSIDLAPSILDWLDLPIPPNFEGRPLAQVLANPELPADTLIATATQAQYPARFAARVGNVKVIESLDTASRQTFDLAADPDEQQTDAVAESATAQAAAALEAARLPLLGRGIQARLSAAVGTSAALTLQSQPQSGTFVTVDRRPGGKPLRLALSPDGLRLHVQGIIDATAPGFRFDRIIDPLSKSPRDRVMVAVNRALETPLVIELGAGAAVPLGVPPRSPAAAASRAAHTSPGPAILDSTATPPAAGSGSTSGGIEVDLLDPRLESATPPACPAPAAGLKLCLWRAPGDAPARRSGLWDPEVRDRLKALGYVTD